jgi:carboxymethylenebutenolidase
MKDHITRESLDGVFGAYIARPKVLPAPAVVVLQELFGVNADIRVAGVHRQSRRPRL